MAFQAIAGLAASLLNQQGGYLMKLKSVALAAMVAFASAGAQAESVVGFSVSPGLYSSAYSLSFASLSDLTGDVDLAGATVAVGVALSNSSGYYMFDSDAADGFSFASLTGGSYTLAFTAFGTGAGAFGGSYNVSAVPEPETYALMLAGLGIIGFIGARRRERN